MSIQDHTLATMPLGDHLEELRKRLFYALLGPIPIVIVCLIFGAPLVELLVEPAREQLLASDQPAKLSIIAAIMLSSPWIIFQFWLFIAPGLFDQEKRFVYFLIPFSTVLSVLGIVFMYFVMLPISLRFLILFGSLLVSQPPPTAPLPDGVTLGSIPILDADPTEPPHGSTWINWTLKEQRTAIDVDPGEDVDIQVFGTTLSSGGTIEQQYRIGEYLNLVFLFSVVLVVSFQLPIVLMLGGWVGLLDHKFLGRYRKHAAFICGISSAILTPSDPFSMLVLMVPLYGLFEFGMLLMRFVPARRVAGVEPPDASDN
ncbi:MAG: twin-arginine translocase subunit TatC [Planctomycetota bacterium]|jgi:sec-independent protein translocase protein TatC